MRTFGMILALGMMALSSCGKVTTTPVTQQNTDSKLATACKVPGQCDDGLDLVTYWRMKNCKARGNVNYCVTTGAIVDCSSYTLQYCSTGSRCYSSGSYTSCVPVGHSHDYYPQ